MNEQEKANQAKLESSHRYVQNLEEFRATAMAQVLNATYAALAAPAKPQPGMFAAITVPGELGEDDAEPEYEEHFAGGDENLTSEELNRD